jgi:flagellar biosynthetic protein FliR
MASVTEELARVGIDFDVSTHLRVFALVFGRFIGIAVPTPFLGGKLIPGRIKFGIPLFFAAFFYPMLKAGVDPARVPEVGFIFFGLVLKEIFIGYSIGFVVSLPFHAIDAAGSFADTQRGTTFAQVVNPALGGQASLIGQLMGLVFLVIFTSSGGLQLTLGALADSYAVFPLLATPKLLHPEAPAVAVFIAHTGHVFVLGVQLALPIVVAMFLADVTLGIVNRTAPNVQVFFLGMGIKALGGLVILFVCLDFMHDTFAQLMVGMVDQIRVLLRSMAAT